MGRLRIGVGERGQVVAAAGWLIALTAAAAIAPAASPAAQPAASPAAQPEAARQVPHSGAVGAAAKTHLGGGAAGPKQAHRSREGSLLTDQSGSFEFVGDRVVFVPAGSRDSFRVLENLALERIVHELGDARDQRSWTVTGQLTEFRGSNYLLVAKALIKTPASAAPPPRPERAATDVPENRSEVANSSPLR